MQFEIQIQKEFEITIKQNLHNACTLAVPLRPISFAAFGITFSASQIGFLAF